MMKQPLNDLEAGYLPFIYTYTPFFLFSSRQAGEVRLTFLIYCQIVYKSKRI